MAQTGYTPILIYSSSTTTNAPAAGNLTNSTLGSELAINITDGKLFYKDNANSIQVIAWKTTPTSAGGTGLTSYTAGDLLFYASGTALSKLAIGASGRYLSSSGTAPQWNAPAALTKTDDTNVTLTLGGSASTALLNAASLTLGWTGTLAVTRGGTGLTSFTNDSIFFAGTTTSISNSSTFLFQSGNLLVGASSAGGGTARAYIQGDGTNPAFRALSNTATTSVYSGVFRHESTTAGAYIQFVTDGGVETGRIYDLAGTMQYASSSDARLKTNVQPIKNGLDSVLALKPCTFDMRRGKNTLIPSAGLIAQEVHDVYPFAVGVGGENENINPWSVDYGKLTPLLISAIQQLKEQIDVLKTQLK